MVTKNTKIQILGLGQLDKKELEAELGHEHVRFEESQIPNQKFGEPATLIAIVALSLSVIKGLTAWLMKKRRKGSVTTTVLIEHPDGRKEQKTITVDVSSSDPEDIMKQLAPAFNFDLSLLSSGKQS